MELRESGEDYLETILELEKKNGIVRSVDVAYQLGVSKPSVSKAMGNLKAAGYVHQESYKDIVLTDKGRQRAEEVFKRHRILSDFFEKILGVSHDIAQRDACRAEHVLSKETMEKILDYMERIHE